MCLPHLPLIPGVNGHRVKFLKTEKVFLRKLFKTTGHSQYRLMMNIYCKDQIFFFTVVHPAVVLKVCQINHTHFEAL